jgi:hypothetical protein
MSSNLILSEFLNNIQLTRENVEIPKFIQPSLFLFLIHISLLHLHTNNWFCHNNILFDISVEWRNKSLKIRKKKKIKRRIIGWKVEKQNVYKMDIFRFFIFLNKFCQQLKIFIISITMRNHAQNHLIDKENSTYLEGDLVILFFPIFCSKTNFSSFNWKQRNYWWNVFWLRLEIID